MTVLLNAEANSSRDDIDPTVDSNREVEREEMGGEVAAINAKEEACCDSVDGGWYAKGTEFGEVEGVLFQCNQVGGLKDLADLRFDIPIRN